MLQMAGQDYGRLDYIYAMPADTFCYHIGKFNKRKKKYSLAIEKAETAAGVQVITQQFQAGII